MSVACSNCQHWQQTQPFPTIGRCRRHAPVRFAGEYLADWPRTTQNDWCGEFFARQGVQLAQEARSRSRAARAGKAGGTAP